MKDAPKPSLAEESKTKIEIKLNNDGSGLLQLKQSLAAPEQYLIPPMLSLSHRNSAVEGSLYDET